MPNIAGRPRKAPRMPNPGEKWCANCLSFKPLDEFGDRSKAYEPGKPVKKAAWCLVCYGQYHRAYNAKRVKGGRDYSAELRRLRVRVLEHYGGKCIGCGETDIDVLCVDHIDPTLSKAQKAQNRPHAGTMLYRDIVKYNYPPDYQVLCRNCNWRKLLHPEKFGGFDS